MLFNWIHRCFFSTRHSYTSSRPKWTADELYALLIHLRHHTRSLRDQWALDPRLVFKQRLLDYHSLARAVHSKDALQCERAFCLLLREPQVQALLTRKDGESLLKRQSRRLMVFLEDPDRRFTPSEDLLLQEVVKENENGSWRSVSDAYNCRVDGFLFRPTKMLMNRYLRWKKLSQRKEEKQSISSRRVVKRWTLEEKERVMELVKAYWEEGKPVQWSAVQQAFPDRTKRSLQFVSYAQQKANMPNK